MPCGTTSSLCIVSDRCCLSLQIKFKLRQYNRELRELVDSLVSIGVDEVFLMSSNVI